MHIGWNILSFRGKGLYYPIPYIAVQHHNYLLNSRYSMGNYARWVKYWRRAVWQGHASGVISGPDTRCVNSENSRTVHWAQPLFLQFLKNIARVDINGSTTLKPSSPHPQEATWLLKNLGLRLFPLQFRPKRLRKTKTSARTERQPVQCVLLRMSSCASCMQRDRHSVSLGDFDEALTKTITSADWGNATLEWVPVQIRLETCGGKPFQENSLQVPKRQTSHGLVYEWRAVCFSRGRFQPGSQAARPSSWRWALEEVLK